MFVNPFATNIFQMQGKKAACANANKRRKQCDKALPNFSDFCWLVNAQMNLHVETQSQETHTICIANWQVSIDFVW